MTDPTTDRITGTLSINVQPQPNGHYHCQLVPALSDGPREDIQCHGKTKEHAIAIALEKLAESYRQQAEEDQKIDDLAVTHDEAGVPIAKQYHVILHYERIAEDESKFEAFHNTIIGNTVVENAMISIVEIDSDLPVELITRSW